MVGDALDYKESLGKRLRLARQRARYKQKDAAKAVGVHFSTMAKYEAGIREPDFETITKLARLYGVSTEYLMTGETSSSENEIDPVQLSVLGNYVRIPILKSMRAGDDLALLEKFATEFLFVDSSALSGHSGFAIENQDTRMLGDHILPGDILIIKASHEPALSDICYVSVRGEDGILGRVRCFEHLCCIYFSNPQFDAIVCRDIDVDVLGIVTEVRRKIHK